MPLLFFAFTRIVLYVNISNVLGILVTVTISKGINQIKVRHEMKTKNDFQSENMKLLMEIFNLKLTLRELYMQKGPASSDYISHSIKLNVLIKEYFEEKTLSLISMSKAELIEIWKQKGFEHLETISASQELDELIFKYQKLQQLGSF